MIKRPWLSKLLLVWLVLSGGLAFAQNYTDSLADRILSNTLRTDYITAVRQADSLSKIDVGRGAFFRNMVALSRFDDLGDTLALSRALTRLESQSHAQAWWEALRLFQFGYCKAALGSSTSAAWNTRKAVKVFEQQRTLEARAFAAIYGYYMEGATSWVPFHDDQRPGLLATLDSARVQSRWYWPLFATSLAWMRFDRQEYAQALQITDAALKKAPSHPVFLQMKGDMLYRLGRYAEAKAVYLKSLQDYAQRAPYSVRWWSAGGNLWRIAVKMGDAQTATLWKDRFASAEFQKIKKWMPESLLEALEDL